MCRNKHNDWPSVCFPLLPLPSCFDFGEVFVDIAAWKWKWKGGRLTLRGRRNLCRSHLFWVLQTNPFATQSYQKGERLLIAMFQGKGKKPKPAHTEQCLSQRNSNTDFPLCNPLSTVAACSLHPMCFQKNLWIQLKINIWALNKKEACAPTKIQPLTEVWKTNLGVPFSLWMINIFLYLYASSKLGIGSKPCLFWPCTCRICC